MFHMLDAVKKDSENRLTIAMSAARPIRMPMFCLNQAKKRPLNFFTKVSDLFSIVLHLSYACTA